MSGLRVAAHAAVALIGVLGSPGLLRAGPLDPTEVQLAAFRDADDGGPVALVRFLKIREPAAYARYLQSSEERVRAAGGERVYGGRLDVVPGNPKREFDELVVEEFPSRAACLEVLGSPSPEREAALGGTHVLAVRPSSRTLRVLVRLLAGAVWLVLGEEVSEAPPALDSLGDEQTALGTAALRTFLAVEQTSSLAMVNLNKPRERARYEREIDEDPDVSGGEAYSRYGRIALWHVFKRGGRPLWMGSSVELLVGAPEHPLSDAWTDFAVVYYPSRLAIRHMAADPDYQTGFPHRTAGLERAAVVPGTPWPEFDPER